MHACPVCGKLFARKDRIPRHVRAVHERTFALSCSICGKGVVSTWHLEQHERTHTPQLRLLVGMRPTLHRLHSSAVSLTDELCALRAQVAQTDKGCAGKSTCWLSVHERIDDTVSFECMFCRKRVHWACAGLDLSSLGHGVCQPCLVERGLGAGACVQAALNAKLLHEHITNEQRKAVVAIPGDGLCLVRSIAHVTGVADLASVLRNALQVLPDVLTSGKVPLDDDAKKKVLAKSTKMQAVSDTALIKQMGKTWDSMLGDVLPSAFARSLGRPLQLLELRQGEPTVTVVASHAEAEGEPIVLMHTWHEIGVDHYDVVS